MRMHRKLTALVLAGALALGACGGDDDESADPNDASTSTSSTAEAGDEEVATTGTRGFLELGDPRLWGAGPAAGDGDQEVAGGEGEGGDGPVTTTPDGVETFEPSANVEPTESEIPMFEG